MCFLPGKCSATIAITIYWDTKRGGSAQLVTFAEQLTRGILSCLQFYSTSYSIPSFYMDHETSLCLIEFWHMLRHRLSKKRASAGEKIVKHSLIKVNKFRSRFCRLDVVPNVSLWIALVRYEILFPSTLHVPKRHSVFLEVVQFRQPESSGTFGGL